MSLDPMSSSSSSSLALPKLASSVPIESSVAIASSSTATAGAKRKRSILKSSSTGVETAEGKGFEEAASSVASAAISSSSSTNAMLPKKFRFADLDQVRTVTEWADQDSYKEQSFLTVFDDRIGAAVKGCFVRAKGKSLFPRDYLSPSALLELRLLSKHVTFFDLVSSVFEGDNKIEGLLKVSFQQEHYAIHNEILYHFSKAASIGAIPSGYHKHLAKLVADHLVLVLEEYDAIDPRAESKKLDALKSDLISKIACVTPTQITKGAFGDVISHTDFSLREKRKEYKMGLLRQSISLSSSGGKVDYSKVSDYFSKSAAAIPCSRIKLIDPKEAHKHHLPKSIADAAEFSSLLADYHSGAWKEEEEKSIKLVEIKPEMKASTLEVIDSFFSADNTKLYFNATRSFSLV